MKTMNGEDKIRERFGTDAGYRVPAGYFDGLAEQVVAILPERKIEAPRPVSRWTRFKPYLYLAAMFAGIWMMMQLYANFTGLGKVNLDNPPESIAMLLEEKEIHDEYMTAESISDSEVEEDVIENYNSIDDFAADFGYKLEPEYANIKI